MKNPVPAVLSKFAFPRSASFPERPAAAGGAAHDAIVESLDASLQSAVDKRDQIEIEFMPQKRPGARTIAAIESYRAVAGIVVPYGRELAQRLTDARGRAGLSRRLNPNDINANAGLRFDDLDLANRVQLARTTIPALPDHLLIATVRDIFAPKEGAPDIVSAYALDSMPVWMRAEIERRAAVSLDELRETMLAKLNPAAAATFETVDYLCDQAAYLVESAQRQLEKVWGVDATIGNTQASAFDSARTALAAALRKGSRAA